MAEHEVTRPVALDPTLLAISQAIRDVTLTTPIVDNLTTNDGAKALSAKQGKILNDTKLDKTNVYNGLDQTSEGYALDARQGKVLNDAITSLNGDVDNLESAISDFVDLYHMTGQVSATSYVLSDNAFRYKKLICKFQGGSTGLHFLAVLYPTIDTGFSFEAFGGSTRFESYGVITSDGMTLRIDGSTVSNHVYNLTVCGVKAY